MQIKNCFVARIIWHIFHRLWHFYVSVATYQWLVVCESIDKAFMVLIYRNIYSVIFPSIKLLHRKKYAKVNMQTVQKKIQ